MSLIILGRQSFERLVTASLLGAAALLLAACSSAPVIPPPSEQPLTKQTMMLLGRKGMDPATPIYIRIFKEESELEVWKARSDGRYYHFKTYPICNWSGGLGPKLIEGDKQAPEGFYPVHKSQMKPDSSYHVAFNLGFPNAYDKANGRTGSFVMVHGKCKSAGCYAMTDALIEEIYALAREAIRGGQEVFPVHAFPFHMTPAKMAEHRRDKWYPFWQVLKQGYDAFETTRMPPEVAVCERRYVVNVKLPRSQVNPEASCPHFERPKLAPFKPLPQEETLAKERVTEAGPRMHGVDPMTVPPATAMALGMTTPPRAGANAGSGVADTARALGLAQY